MTIEDTNPWVLAAIVSLSFGALALAFLYGGEWANRQPPDRRPTEEGERED